MKDLKLIWNGRASGLLGASIIFIHSGFMIVRDKLTSYLTKKNLGTTGYNVRINSFFTYRYPNNITLGNNISIARGVKLSSENPSGKLVINDNVILTFDVQIDFSGSITIGRNTLISKNTIIETHDHGDNPLSDPIYKELHIEDNVWIGMNAIILSGVRKIGHNSIVAAGSVVTREVPPNCIVAGIPARIIKNRQVPNK